MAATIFVDQATRFTFVNLQYSTAAEETIQGKEKFEKLMRSYGRPVQAYHADNGIFAGNEWRRHCEGQGQMLTFAGVGAHHQNEIAERKIQDLQDLSRAMLIHAKFKWPGAVTDNLWPYAIRMAGDVLNNSPTFLTDKSPLQDLSNASVNINWSHWHTFGAPAYVLLSHLQQEPRIHGKWRGRVKEQPGIYLGHSPIHARNIGLILDTETGLTSPQFHTTIDDHFDTVNQHNNNSAWLVKCGFKRGGSTVKTVPLEPRASDFQLQPNQSNSQQVQNESNSIQDMTSEGEAIPAVRRSTRETRPPDRLTYQTSYIFDEELTDVYCYAASADPDTMYLHEARREPDCPGVRYPAG